LELADKNPDNGGVAYLIAKHYESEEKVYLC
jgi:hypothetical protein